MSHPGGWTPAKRTEPVGKTLRQLAAYVRPYRGRFIFATIAFTISVLATVFAPRLLGAATDVVVTGALKHSHIDFGHLAQILGYVAGLYLIGAVGSWLGGVVVRAAIQRMGWTIRAQVQAKIDRLPLAALDGESRGDLMSRVTNDVDNIQQSTQQSLTQAFTAILTVIGIGAMMLSLSWRLTLAALVVLPLGGVIITFLMKRGAPHFRSQWQHTGDLSTLVEDTFTGHTVIAAFNMQEQVSDGFATTNSRLFDATRRSQFISGLMHPAMAFASNLSYLVVAVIGALQVTSGHMSIGGVQAFLQYSRQFNDPIGQLAGVANLIQSGFASAERVFKLLNEPEMAADATDTLPPGAAAAIRLENVRFGYNPDKPVISNLSLDVAAGETVAIVGATGAGKTTLVNLLMRFYEIDAGHIYFDGIDTATISKSNLRSRFGMVLQDTWLFNGTIAENIAYGAHHLAELSPQEQREQVVAAAKATSVHHMIRTLPDGYDTVIDENSGISAGQRQLLTIARAFIADPQILILDEATSSVDTRTERAVQEATRKLRAGRTAFIIAHRLSTIRDADKIVVMEHGDVVEIGTHHQLLEAGGAYARLHASQFQQA